MTLGELYDNIKQLSYLNTELSKYKYDGGTDKKLIEKTQKQINKYRAKEIVLAPGPCIALKD